MKNYVEQIKIRQNRLYLILLVSSMLIVSQAKADPIDSLKILLINKVDSAGGMVYFNDNMVVPGQLFTLYQNFWFDDPNNQMQLQKSWIDSFAFYTHYRFQQYYLNIPVEGAIMLEHATNGYVKTANGRVADSIQNTTESALDVQFCLDTLLDSLQGYDFAWLYPDYESEIKTDLNDTNATYYPSGELVWALKPDANLKNVMDGNDYVLAYEFEITSIVPHMHRNYFVSALTGEVLKYIENSCTDGPANIMNIGSKTIDTQWKGGFAQKWILKANNGRNIHTKEDKIASWGIRSEIKDDDDNWGGSNIKSTTAHWVVMQSWDFFKSYYKLTSMNGAGKEIRVQSNFKENNAKYTHKRNGNDYLSFGDIGGYSAILDIAGHEFGHGVDQYSANLAYLQESGALDESFSDIYGFMVERYAQPYPYTWTMGEKATAQRDMSDPNAYQQPDTYEGTHWFPIPNCNLADDLCGVHTNSGVQNFWFYLLSEGGQDVNDNNDAYDVQSIGIDNAALIAYHSHVNYHNSSSTYQNARANAIASAISLFGECSFEHNQVESAWHAVGLGARSVCASNAVLDQNNFGKRPQVFPNPTLGEVTLDFKDNAIQSLRVVNNLGQSVLIEITEGLSSYVISLEHLDNGLYFIELTSEKAVHNYKVIKQ